MLLILAGALLLSGCSTTRHVTLGDTDEKRDTLTVATVNERISGRTVELILRGGGQYAASDVTLASDSCRFLADGDRVRRSVPLGDVYAVKKTDHLSGAIGGMGLGLFGGGALGYGAATLSSMNGSSEAKGWRGFYAFLGGIAGGTVGIIVGAIVGSRVEYQVVHPLADQDSAAVRGGK